ncbi:MAG: DUF1080 domain-containing protein [Planctomycetia bacterium]|nr:DUF1080 domain-containing protein [Planctomycetia bacterium]
MNVSRVLLCAVLDLALCVCAVRAEDWKPLFNGRDLTGWKAIDGPITSWQVEDGMLFCSGKGSGWLSTEREYANCEIELEFRVPPGGNSGVFLRAPHEGNPAFAGMEVQILDDYDPQYKDIKPAQHCGSLYGVAAAEPRVSKKAGEWQKMSILLSGNRVRVTLNGTQVVDADITAHPDKLAEHPGLKRTTGYVGLQNHGSRLDFRNIRLRSVTP